MLSHLKHSFNDLRIQPARSEPRLSKSDARFGKKKEDFFFIVQICIALEIGLLTNRPDYVFTNTERVDVPDMKSTCNLK